MNVDINGNRKLMALFFMLALGIALLALIGEAAKFVMPHDSIYYLLVNKVYILAAAIFLLLLGINRININSVRDLIAIFVMVLLSLLVLWQLDKVASGILWNGAYPTVYGRIPENYEAVFLQSLDVVGLIAGAVGAFLVLLKALDLTKDRLAGPAKEEKESP